MFQSLNRPSTDSTHSQQVPPSYQDATRGRSDHVLPVAEKSTQLESNTESSPKKSSRFATLKSILSGQSMCEQVTRNICPNAITRRCLSASSIVRPREVRHRIPLVVKEMTNYHGWMLVPSLCIAASRVCHALHENS